MDADKSVTANFAVFDVTISRSGNYAVLDWTHQAAAVDHYAVYRSLTAPYFVPGRDSSAGGRCGASRPAFPDDDPDTGADLTVAGASYFYAVVPMNANDEPIGSANRTGAFVFGLVPGSGP